MLPSRFVPAQSSSSRKSRLEGKPSLLPKLRRPGSTDRLSTEVRRPSTTGQRSSSAEPRPTLGGRLSRDASATKLSLNSRARSQQGDRFGQSSMTPLRSSQYSIRPTTTPVRTPTEDRTKRSWQTSLDRAVAFVTVKDQRPISNVAWQRSEAARVAERLAARLEARGGGGAGGMTLIRPLTIARFVDITGALLAAIIDVKLTNDNYVTKVPHLAKRLLYPGNVSKSWLKTVNTLHAFPHALALVAYLLDLVTHIEMPVSDDWLYVGKDEQAYLRRDYVNKCWIRFQDPDYQFEDLTEEYVRNLTALLGNDEEKIAELQQTIKDYEARLEDEAEAAARAEEARRRARRDALLGALRAERAARRAARAACEQLLQQQRDGGEALRQLDLEIERATAESQQLKLEVESQPFTVSERTRLLDEVEYAVRVRDSKRALAEQIAKMVLSKETELALWQKRTLDSCVEYKQGLIHLSAQHPRLADLAFDEKELMEPECANWVSQAVDVLREHSASLAERRAELARSKSALARKRDALLEEAHTKIAEVKATIEHDQRALEEETACEARAAAAAAAALRGFHDRITDLQRQQADYNAKDKELEYWEAQENAWRTKLAAMQDYIASQSGELERARAIRLQLVSDKLKLLIAELPEL